MTGDDKEFVRSVLGRNTGNVTDKGNGPFKESISVSLREWRKLK